MPMNIPKELEKQIQQRYTPAQQPRVQAWLTDVRARLGGVSRRHAGMMLRDHLEALELLTDGGFLWKRPLPGSIPASWAAFTSRSAPTGIRWTTRPKSIP